MPKRYNYGEIEEPTDFELAEIERLLNPDKLLQEDIWADVSVESASEECWLDFSRTEGGARRDVRTHDRTNAISQSYNLRLNKISLDELELDKRIITELNKIDIFSVSDLITESREKLKSLRFIGTKGVTEISEVLLEMNLHLEGDEIYKCIQCSKKFVTEYNSVNTKYCPLCQIKRGRLSKIGDLRVSMLPPDYSTYTNMGAGFSLIVNVENCSYNQLKKVALGDFYVVSDGRQHSPKYFLSGYMFTEENIWPMTTRSLAKIWSTESLGKEFLTEGDYSIITIISDGYTHMFKFIYNGSEWILDDYFCN